MVADRDDSELGEALPCRRRAWQCRAGAGGLLFATILGGCSTTSIDSASGSRRGPSAVGEDGSSAGSVGARSRGGYYLDDGPGDRDPAELAALAELLEPVPLPEPLHARANRPYRVMGNDYRPMMQREPFLQRGVASWYGRKFHGQPTSIGERYDMYAMTAAHPTLPIPSYARVTNLENGRRVVVRVNDRGPFLHGRTIDLSYLAAYKLGYVDRGSAEVEVELLDPSRPMPALTVAPVSTAVVDPGQAASRPLPAPQAAAPGEFRGPPSPGQPAAQPANRSAVQPMAQPVAQTSSQPVVQPVVQPMAQRSSQPVAQPTAQQLAQQMAQPEPPAVAQGEPARPHYLQLGAFSARTNAEAASAHLRRQLDWLQVPIQVASYGSLFRVQAGPYPVRELAARAGIEVESRTGLRPLLVPRLPD